MRKTLIATALALAACKGPQVRPTAVQDFSPIEVNNCWTRARNIDTTLGANPEKPLKVTVFMYVDTDGAVPAAFIHDAENVAGGPLFGCLMDSAAESKFESENSDYIRPQPLLFSGKTAQVKQLHEQKPGPLDEKMAQSSLTFTTWATAADKGWGYYYVHDYAKAQEQFKAALAAKADDPKALRGMALTLLDSKGDLKEARANADKAVQAAPTMVAAWEAQARVCLAQKEDECTLNAFEHATKGELDKDGKVVKAADEKQRAARSYELVEIQDQVKAVAEKFNADAEGKRKEAEDKARAAAQKANDPTGCGQKFPEGDERTLCLVKFCFEKGAQEYAKSLKPLTGQDYSAGEWKIGKGKSGNEVSVAIRAASAKKSKTGPSAHDAIWSLDAAGQAKAANIDAAQIAQKHNACNK